MKKETIICFRTSEEVRKALEAIARADRRSLPSTVEIILTDYLDKGIAMPRRKERRRYPRKTVQLPAYVALRGSALAPHGAVVLDVSLGGMNVSMPKDCVPTMYESSEKPEFEASFVVPGLGEPIRLVCRTERMVPSNGDVRVGASFADADFVNYRNLQQFLMQTGSPGALGFFRNGRGWKKAWSTFSGRD